MAGNDRASAGNEGARSTAPMARLSVPSPACKPSAPGTHKLSEEPPPITWYRSSLSPLPCSS